MNQTYVYRKHLRGGFFNLFLMIAVIFSYATLLALGLILTDGNEITAFKILIWGVVMLIVFMLLLLEFVVIYQALWNRFKSIHVSLTQDAIIYNNAKTQTIIPYEEIEKLETPSIKYAGGWLKIIYRGGNIRLTVVLENIGDFLYELKKKLKEREMTYVYNETKLFSFFKTAVFSDESWDRLYQNIKLHLASCYFTIIMTTLLLVINGYSGLNKCFVFGSIFAPMLGYIIGEIIIGTRVRKRVQEEELNLLPRDRVFEQKVIKIGTIGATIAYLLIILLIVIISRFI